MHSEVFNTLHHAVSNATGTMFYVYSLRGELVLAQNIRELIVQHLSASIYSTGWDLLNDEQLAGLLTEREDISFIPLVKKLRALVHQISYGP